MPDQMKYTSDHEWIQIEDGDVAVIGITQYAQDALGDLVYVELPEVGAQIEKGDDFAVVESVKTAAEVFTPVTGEVVAINDELPDNPEKIKESLEAGWIAKVKLSDITELEELMDQPSYEAYIETLDE